MLFKVKLENDIEYEFVEADDINLALNDWLLKHKDYWLLNILNENYKQLDIDVNGKIYDIDIQLMIHITKKD